jgi:hypothetical protein
MSHANSQGPGQEAGHSQAIEGEGEGKGLGEGREEEERRESGVLRGREQKARQR